METIDFNQMPNPEQLARVTEWLARADHRVIRPLVIRTTYSEEPPPEKLITVAILDTETTGTNAARDKIIELGMLLVEVCPATGQAYRVIEVFDPISLS